MVIKNKILLKTKCKMIRQYNMVFQRRIIVVTVTGNRSMNLVIQDVAEHMYVWICMCMYLELFHSYLTLDIQIYPSSDQELLLPKLHINNETTDTVIPVLD